MRRTSMPNVTVGIALALVCLSGLLLGGCGDHEALRRDAKSAAELMAKIEVEEKKLRLKTARREISWDEEQRRVQQLRKGNNHLMRLMAPHEQNRRLFMSLYLPLTDKLVHEALAQEGILDAYYKEVLGLSSAPARAPTVVDDRVLLAVHYASRLAPAGVVETMGITAGLLPLPLVALLLFKRSRTASRAQTGEELASLKTFLRRVRFVWRSGEVIERGVWSETTVSGGGSTRYSNGAYSSYHVDPVRSRTSEIAELWIREADSGEQFSVRIVDSSFRARASHEVVTVWAAPGRRSAGWLVYLGNLTTRSGCARPLAPRLVRSPLLHVVAPWLALVATPGVLELGREVPGLDTLVEQGGEAVATWVVFLGLWITTYKAIHAYCARSIRARAHAIAEHCLSRPRPAAYDDAGGAQSAATTVSSLS